MSLIHLVDSPRPDSGSFIKAPCLAPQAGGQGPALNRDLVCEIETRASRSWLRVWERASPCGSEQLSMGGGVGRGRAWRRSPVQGPALPRAGRVILGWSLAFLNVVFLIWQKAVAASKAGYEGSRGLLPSNPLNSAWHTGSIEV